MLNANLALLIVCQLVSVSGTVLVITIGGIVGAEIAPSPEFATLPMSVMVVGTACGAIPAAMLMRRIGRRYGFMVGLATAACAMLVAHTALSFGHFGLFCVGTTLLGLTLAFSQQYRFAAAESVPAEKVSQAVSIVLLGSIGGAIVGPELATTAVGDTLERFQRPLLIVAGMYAVAMCLAYGLRFSAPVAPVTEEPRDAARPLRELLRERVFLVAVLGGVVGQGVMTLVMTATPLAMHVHDGFSLDATASVIRNHVIAMYIPALVSGVLIARFGVLPIMLTGVLVFVVTLLIALAGREYIHYSASMIALGIGWNFLFVGGTTLLVRTHRHAERFTAQAFNDFSVFGGSALASLGAGILLHGLGWNGVIYVAAPVVVFMLAALVATRRDPRIGRVAPAPA